MPDGDWWHMRWPEPEAVLRAVGLKPDMRAVDLCCGEGYFTRPMCELDSPGDTWALDLDKDLLKQAEMVCVGYSSFHPILADARNLPGQIEIPVDFIVIANTFHGVPDKAAVSRAVHDSLASGGLFAIFNWYRRPREETTVPDQPRGPDAELVRTHALPVCWLAPGDVLSVSIAPRNGEQEQVQCKAFRAWTRYVSSSGIFATALAGHLSRCGDLKWRNQPGRGQGRRTG